jgi:diamine N-acetyltransferase
MLEDGLIYLRKLEETDLDRTWEWVNDPDFFLMMGVDAPVTKTAQKRWFDKLDRINCKIVFAICLREGDKHVGNVSLDLIDYRHRNARLSIVLADPALRGRGIGSQAIELLLEYAFSFLNLHRLYCKAAAGDARILSFYSKLGFKLEGQLREHEYISGRYVDKIILGLLREEWALSS